MGNQVCRGFEVWFLYAETTEAKMKKPAVLIDDIQMLSGSVCSLFSSFNEESHNCYSYSLTFINCVLATQSKPALSKDEFTRSFVLPRIKRASKYMMLCREISQNHFYIVDRPRRNSGEGPSEDEDSKNK